MQPATSPASATDLTCFKSHYHILFSNRNITFGAFENGFNEDGILGQPDCDAQDEVGDVSLLTDWQVGAFLEVAYNTNQQTAGAWNLHITNCTSHATSCYY